jgi:hypothetical protein
MLKIYQPRFLSGLVEENIIAKLKSISPKYFAK